MSGHLGTRIDAWAASGARLGIEYRYPLLDRRLLEFVLGRRRSSSDAGVKAGG